jgi:intracellular sulfur oxidation DsrE/DsrF family protein
MSHILLRLLMVVASALMLTAPVRAQDATTEAVEKVVYHADFADPRRFSAMLTSINNMVSEYQQTLKEYDVRIVFVSHGIRFLTADPLAGTPFAEDAALKARKKELLERLKGLHDTHDVKLELCEITREAARLDPGKILSGVVRVPSGVVRLADLQHQGFAYIKIE